MNVLVAIAALASLTCALTLNEPAVVGVPVIWPVEEFRVNPAGSPNALHVYGGVPPVADRAAEYAELTVPPGSDDVLITSGAGGEDRGVAEKRLSYFSP